MKEMTHLRYFMPIVIQGNKMGLKSTFYVGPSNKYNCPHRHRQIVVDLANRHNIDIAPYQSAGACSGILFSSEKTGIELVKSNKKAKKVVATYQTDFIESHRLYEPFVDHILMPSKWIAEYYNLENKKNLYLGIPKYDTHIDAKSVRDKYGIKNGKNALVIWPKIRDEHASGIDMGNILHALKSQGFTILVKTRGKDPLKQDAKSILEKNGDHYFEDTSWHPHTTQELLSVSDIAINFGSTTIEECVMHNVPLINFDIKPAVRNGSKRPYRVTHEYLYNYNYCIQAEKDIRMSKLVASIQHLATADLQSEFRKSRVNHLYEPTNCSKLILERLL
jgi:hypothetical protein